MKASIPARALAAALASAAPGAASTRAQAAIKDYAFQLVDTSVKVGPATIISVRLVDNPDREDSPRRRHLRHEARHGARRHGRHGLENRAQFQALSQASTASRRR